MITVGIVDDHEAFRLGVRTGVTNAQGMDVAWDCGSGEEAVEHMRRAPADVVVLDLHLGSRSRLSGIETCRSLKALWPSTAVLLVTALGQDLELAEAAGAAAVIEKDRPFAEVLAAIRAHATGVRPAARRRRPSVDSAALSDRERQILELIARGATSAMIAAKLAIAPKTVDNHVQNILKKLRARNRVQAAAIFTSGLASNEGDSRAPRN